MSGRKGGISFLNHLPRKPPPSPSSSGRGRCCLAVPCGGCQRVRSAGLGQGLRSDTVLKPVPVVPAFGVLFHLPRPSLSGHRLLWARARQPARGCVSVEVPWPARRAKSELTFRPARSTVGPTSGCTAGSVGDEVFSEPSLGGDVEV